MKDNNEIKEDLKVEGNEKTKFKSKLIEKLIGKYQKNDVKKEEKEEQPKDAHAINLSDILVNIDSLSEEEISNIVSDVNSNNITISVNKSAIKMLNNKDLDQEKIQKILTGLTPKINIDISSMADLSTEELNSIKQRCTINKVYVNTGYDVAAKQGYDVDKYMQMRTNADLIRETAIGKNKDSMSEMDKVKRLYKYIVDHTGYDYGEVAPSYTKSRNLENFFTKGRRVINGKIMGKGKAVCSGVASGLQNMLECEGIECQYVQGWATVGNRKEYHAWLKAKIDGKWVNLDPTWDMCKVGPKPFSYFAKDDRYFNKDHQVNYRYAPNYSRGASIPTPIRYINTSADRSDIAKNPMGDIIDREYVQNYLSSRNDQLQYVNSYYDDISNEDLEELNAKEIPAAMTAQKPKLTLKQKLADFLYKGKHLKNISFIKKFVENNSLKCKADIKEKEDKEVAARRSFVQKIDGKLEEANKNYKEQPQVTVTKNDKNEDRDVG